MLDVLVCTVTASTLELPLDLVRFKERSDNNSATFRLRLGELLRKQVATGIVKDIATLRTTMKCHGKDSVLFQKLDYKY
jgi:hypothetical protein